MNGSERIALLVADVGEELQKLQRLREEYDELLTKADLSAEEASPYDKAAIGFYLHNFYNGCEGIFRSIARFFENDLAAESWHTDLLKRMKLEVAGYRPRVINGDLFLILDDFRAFRHRFRHCYSFELDWARMKLVAAKLTPAHRLLEDQVRHFLNELGDIAEESHRVE